ARRPGSRAHGDARLWARTRQPGPPVEARDRHGLAGLRDRGGRDDPARARRRAFRGVEQSQHDDLRRPSQHVVGDDEAEGDEHRRDLEDVDRAAAEHDDDPATDDDDGSPADAEHGALAPAAAAHADGDADSDAAAAHADAARDAAAAAGADPLA